MNSTRANLLILVLGIAFSGSAFSDPPLFNSPPVMNPRIYPAARGYMIPNEEYPLASKSEVENAAKGAYISVGTERGFIGATLARNTTHLFLIDRDPTVVLYNRINIGLLEMAKDREDYLDLRLKASWHDWSHRAENSKLSPELKSLFENEKSSEWWNDNVREKFKGFHTPPRKAGDPFFGANYLYNEGQFNTLSHLARAHRIEAHEIDLMFEKPKLKLFVQSLKARNIPLGVLDLSNAWATPYMGSETEKVVNVFKEISVDQSSMLVTFYKPHEARLSLHDNWLYKAVHLSEVPEVFFTSDDDTIRIKSLLSITHPHSCAEEYRKLIQLMTQSTP